MQGSSESRLSKVMDCAQESYMPNDQFLTAFNEKVMALQIPLSGSLDLTYRCNLRCVHCYLGALRNDRNKYREMSTGKVLSIIDEAVAAGCLYLLITGGEPLIRDDFSEIYSHARRSGLIVTVFTNGTLISDDILELFQELPPNQVEISLYGASAATYEKITRVPGSYDSCVQGIGRMLECGIKVALKTILMTLNSDELSEMEKFANNLGVRFRFDAVINACLDGDRSPLNLRVPPEEAIEKEFSNPKTVLGWKEFVAKYKPYSTNDLYECGAGICCFHVDAHAALKPCLMVTDIRYDLSDRSFLEGWHHIARDIRKRKLGANSLCRNCDKRHLCGYCPGFLKLETGFEDVYSPYLCALGSSRLERIVKEE
jgi:MoaA/NifB/PqqE/SkfB family radical SAM enzyme